MLERVLISGYYGFDNMGDEAVLAGLLAGMRQIAPEVQPVVLSACPETTRVVHGVECVPRAHVGAVWQAMRSSAGLISGGGSLLQDVTSKRSVYYYLAIMVMAQLAKRPFCICGQGMGPLQSPMARRVTGRVLRGARSIWVRDHAAGKLVDALLTGSDKPDALDVDKQQSFTITSVVREYRLQSSSGRVIPLYIAADPAFLLPVPDRDQVSRIYQELVPRNAGAGPVWLVAMRPWQHTQWQSHLVQALVNAAKTVDACLVFLALHPDQDQTLAERLYQDVQAQGVCSYVLAGLDLHQVRALLAGADMVIAMRLHALIMAVAAGVPGVAVSYDPKVTAFAQEMALPCLPLQDLDATGAEHLTEQIISASMQQARLRTHLEQVVTEQRQRALQVLAVSLASLGLPTTVHGYEADMGS
jgi:polysaccharide pyruvyl transferase WcaK-like protein